MRLEARKTRPLTAVEVASIAKSRPDRDAAILPSSRENCYELFATTASRFDELPTNIHTWPESF
jgi:hypothetical protein